MWWERAGSILYRNGIFVYEGCYSALINCNRLSLADEVIILILRITRSVVMPVLLT